MMRLAPEHAVENPFEPTYGAVQRIWLETSAWIVAIGGLAVTLWWSSDRMSSILGIGLGAGVYTLLLWPIEAWTPAGRRRRSRILYAAQFIVGFVVGLRLGQWL